MDTLPGARVLVFDHLLYRDDVSTPRSFTMRPATVVARYGKRSQYNPSWIYPDLVDVLFDHRPNVSHGHFTDYVEAL